MSGNPNSDAMTPAPVALMLSPVQISTATNATAKNAKAQTAGK